MIGDLYSTQVTIEDGESTIAVDFLIQLASDDPNPPTFVGDPDPICGSENAQSVLVGSTLMFNVTGSDGDGDALTLNVAGLPAGASMDPPLPESQPPSMNVSSEFSWTPVVGDVGISIVNFTLSNFVGGFTLCPVTISVSDNAVVPGDDVVVLPPDPDEPVIAVVQKVVKPGTIKQFSGCVIEDDRGTAAVELDLVQKIKDTNTPGCNKIEEELVELEPVAAKLKKYQRALFKDPADNNKKKIAVTLIKSKNLAGEPDQLTKGVVVSEEDAIKGGLTEEPLCNTEKVSESPSTVGVNLSDDEPNGDKTRNLAGTCNRVRSFGHFSDHLLFYPIKNDSSFLKPKPQVNQEAADFRDAVGAEQAAGCVDGPFLRDLHRNFNKAMRLVNKRKYDDGICALQDLTVFALDPAGDDSVDPYGICPNDPGGHLPSRLIALTYQIHRGLRDPDDFVLFPVDPRILCRLPPFPGEMVPMCPPLPTACPTPP